MIRPQVMLLTGVAQIEMSAQLSTPPCHSSPGCDQSAAVRSSHPFGSVPGLVQQAAVHGFGAQVAKLAGNQCP